MKSCTWVLYFFYNIHLLTPYPIDLQLVVKNTNNVIQSFEKYVETELLDGQNQYMAEGHGLQDARRGVRFLSLPPVLMLQLKRFEYNFEFDNMYKVCVCRSRSSHIAG